VADQEYYFAGTHADTLYTGEGEDAKCMPVGPGDTFTLSKADLENEANAHLFEGETPMIAVVPELAPEPVKAEAETTDAKKEVKK